jgi:hypothetical protein
METIQPERFTEEPDIAGPQIIILVTHETDVFVTVPDIAVRNHYRGRFHRWRSHIYRSRSHNHQRAKRHPSIGFNDAARHKPACGH